MLNELRLGLTDLEAWPAGEYETRPDIHDVEQVAVLHEMLVLVVDTQRRQLKELDAARMAANNPGQPGHRLEDDPQDVPRPGWFSRGQTRTWSRHATPRF